VPAAAAWTGVPVPTAMSIPSCIRPQREPKGLVTGPETGHESRPPPERAGALELDVCCWAARMRAADTYYYAFEASLIRERQELGFISSIITIGLSGAVPLVSAVDTKNILGAASAGLQGATKAYSDEVLFQKTVQVLATQMRARRDIVASEIIERLRTLDIDAYPLSMALGDVDEYYAAGTIAGALIEIQKTVSAESRSAENQKAQAIIRGTFGFDDDALHAA